MSEIVEFVKHGAMRVTPAILEETIRKLPLWKAGFTQIEAPDYPHLNEQLALLLEAVEDVYGGVYKRLPYAALGAAVFALKYTAEEYDLIPDSNSRLGRADDSSVVRAALILFERAFAEYAASRGREWSTITTKP